MKKFDYSSFLFNVFSPLLLGTIIAFLFKDSFTSIDNLNRNINFPPIIFIIVWSALYLLMGIWYFKFEKDNKNELINSIYWISLFVNLMFVPILFSLNNLVLALIDVIVLFGMILFLFIYSLKQKQNTTSKIEITEKKFNDRVYKGDQLLIPTENGGNIVLTVKDTLSSFGLETPNGTFYVDLAEEAEIDIDGDNVSDFILYVSDISSTDYKRGAEISVLLRHGFVFADGSSDSVDLAEIPFANELKNKHPYKVILEDNRAYPFTVNISFRGSCLFRDRVDRNPAIETYFERGELFTATPKNGIRLWISNANALKITIIADAKTFDLDIGEADSCSSTFNSKSTS